MLDFLEILASIIGYVVVAAAAAVAIAETVVRVYRAIDSRFFTELVSRRDYIDPAYHPYLHFVDDWSRAMFRYLPIGLRLFNTEISVPGRITNNSLGFRCPEFTDRDRDEMRAILLGGSQAWGCGASSNETTIAGHLERLMNDKGELLAGRKRARVFNLAQINGLQTQDILTTVFYGSRLEPEIAVSVTGWNELVVNYMLDRNLMEKFRVFYVDEMEGWEPPQVIGRNERLLKECLERWLRRTSASFDALWPRKKEPELVLDQAIRDRVEVTSEIFCEHLRHLTALGKAYGFTHVQILQPHLYRKRFATPEEERIVELYEEARPVFGGKAAGEYLRGANVYGHVVDRIRESPEEFGPVLDLSEMFLDEREKMFYTLVHLTDAGYVRMAERIYGVLRQLSRNPGLTGLVEG